MKNLSYAICLLSITIILKPGNGYTQEKGKGIALETLGFFGALSVYESYEVIGAMHDGYLEKAWEVNTVKNVLDEQKNMLEKSKLQWSTLEYSGFLTDQADSAFIQQLWGACNDLIDEAEALERYVNDPTDSNSATYQEARKKAWRLIAYLMGIKEEEEKE
jgi:hypothetical protein